MAVYISLLRGINVSGKNKILMNDLTSLYESLGFKNITTYIQSGNVIFKSDKNNNLPEQIASKIKELYAFEIPVLIKSMTDFTGAIKKNPFINDKKIDIDKLHITFLDSIPTKNAIEKLSETKSADHYKIIDSNVYLYCPNGYGNTKLNNTLIEKKLGVNATTRNWKTCTALIDILNTKYQN
jgi:uncharacterized protein (DUF1697 family)